MLSTTVVRPLVFVENQVVFPKPIDCRHLWLISSRPRKNCGALFKGCPTLMFGVCFFFHKEPRFCMQQRRITDALKEFSTSFYPTSDFVGQTSDAATGVATIIVNDAGKHVGHRLP